MKRLVAAVVATFVALGAQTAFAAWLPLSTASGTSTARNIGVPTSVIATALTFSSVQVSWSAPAGVAPAGYTVRRTAPSSTIVCTVPAATTTCTDTGLTASTTYTYTVESTIGTNWDSGPSAPASATTPAAPTFKVTVPSGTRTAGTAFTATLTATTNGVTTDTSYSGVKTITFSGPANAPSGTAPSYPATVTFAAGVGSASITLYAAESTTLAATDGTRSGSAAVTVRAASASQLRYTSSSADCSGGYVVVGNGGSWTSKVTTYDPYLNPATRTTNRTVNLSRSPAQGTLSPTSLTILANTSETSGSATYTLPNGNPPNINVTAASSGLTSTVCQVRKS